ncbi:hypothetical protein BsWGS_16819 [Bradybaena similaris]
MEKPLLLWIKEKHLAYDIISERIICEKVKQLYSDINMMCICCLNLLRWVLFRVFEQINSLCIISNFQSFEHPPPGMNYIQSARHYCISLSLSVCLSLSLCACVRLCVKKSETIKFGICNMCTYSSSSCALPTGMGDHVSPQPTFSNSLFQLVC